MHVAGHKRAASGRPAFAVFRSAGVAHFASRPGRDLPAPYLFPLATRNRPSESSQIPIGVRGDPDLVGIPSGPVHPPKRSHRVAGPRSLTDVRSRSTKAFMSWACPRCHRTFRQVNQRHACGVGSAATLLKGRPPALADLYRKLETTVRRFGDVEVVTRNRYALFRATRIFADLTVMRDALRVVIHLSRKAGAPCFIKIGQADKRVSHVALVRTAGELRTIIPFLREAFDFAVGEES